MLRQQVIGSAGFCISAIHVQPVEVVVLQRQLREDFAQTLLNEAQCAPLVFFHKKLLLRPGHPYQAHGEVAVDHPFYHIIQDTLFYLQVDFLLLFQRSSVEHLIDLTEEFFAPL